MADPSMEAVMTFKPFVPCILAGLGIAGCETRVREPVVIVQVQAEATAYCGAAERGRRIFITASNNSPRPMICRVACVFERADGNGDSVTCEGLVPGGAERSPFCERIDPERSYRRMVNTAVDCTFAREG
jgi:hypothetical protein